LDIFGKKELKNRVKDLESNLEELTKEKEELLSTLQRREEKIRKLTNAYQDTKIALKAAEQKSIESGIQIPPNKKDLTVQGVKRVPREMDLLIRRLQSIKSPEDDLITAHVTPNGELPPETTILARSVKSMRGFIILQYPKLFNLLFIPPLPIAENLTSVSSNFQLDSFKEMLETPLLVISIHAGDSFLGLALSKDSFQLQETIRSQVKEKHSKGGWSQKRFERLRENDIENHVAAVIKKLKESRETYSSIARFAVLGGDPLLLKQIQPAVNLPVIERRLEKHDEKRLDKLLDEVYSFKCYRF
jgi:hypothetical protein